MNPVNMKSACNFFTVRQYNIEDSLVLLRNQLDRLRSSNEGCSENNSSSTHEDCGMLLLSILNNLLTITNPDNVTKYMNRLNEILYATGSRHYNKILLIICNHEVENDRRSRVLDIVIELFTTLIKRDINLITDITSDLMILDIKTAIDLFRCWISSDNLSGLYFILTIKMLNTGVYRNLFYSDFDYQQLNKILNLFFQKINVQSIDQFIFIKQLNFFRFMSRECQKFELQVIDNDFNTLMIKIRDSLLTRYMWLVNTKQLSMKTIIASINDGVYLLLSLGQSVRDKTDQTNRLCNSFCNAIYARVSRELEANSKNISYDIIFNILCGLRSIATSEHELFMEKLIISLYQRFISVTDHVLKLNIALRMLDFLELIDNISSEMLAKVQEITDFLFNNNISICNKLITPRYVKFASNNTIINYHKYLIEQRCLHPLEISEQNQLRIMRSISITRDLFLKTQMPPLLINMQSIDMEGRAYEIHKIRNIIPHIRSLINRFISTFEINVDYEAMKIGELYLMLQVEINIIFSRDEDAYNRQCAHASLDMIYNARNTPIGQQFFNDLPYWFAVIKSDKISWNKEVVIFDGRLRQILLAFIDSTNAYGNVDINGDLNANMSCLSGAYERPYVNFNFLNESFTLLFALQASKQSGADIYAMLEDLLQNNEFKNKIINQMSIDYQSESITIAFVANCVKNIIVNMQKDRMNEMLDQYASNITDGDLPANLMNERALNFWNKVIYPDLVQHLEVNIGAILERYDDSDETFDAYNLKQIIESCKNSNK